LKGKNNALENLLIKNQTNLVEDVNIIRETIVKSEKRILELSPKLVDLHMYRRFNKIPPETQNLLMQYSLLIKRIEDDVLGRDRQSMHKEKIKIFENIKSYFPVLAVTNLSINHICPLSKNIIDLLIIDESSQADIPSAIPLIYRAKKVLILGDDKQLPFVSSISSIDVQKLEQKYNFEIPKDLKFSYSKSLFDLFSQFINKNTNHV
jgi:superfamily I DNA and/or RNA helicase